MSGLDDGEGGETVAAFDRVAAVRAAAAALRAEYETITAAEQAEKAAREARESFVRHEITARGPGWWKLHARGADGHFTGNLAYDVIVRGGRLLVHGDFDLCAFESYHRTRENGPEAVVAWMGYKRSAEGYVAEKASIALGSRVVYVSDPALFREEMIDLVLGEATEEDTDLDEKAIETIVQNLESVFAEVEEGGSDGSGVLPAQHEAYSLTWPVHLEAEDLYRCGDVVSSRVWDGHAAVARLWSLLEAEREAVGHAPDPEAALGRLCLALTGLPEAELPNALPDFVEMEEGRWACRFPERLGSAPEGLLASSRDELVVLLVPFLRARVEAEQRALHDTAARAARDLALSHALLYTDPPSPSR